MTLLPASRSICLFFGKKQIVSVFQKCVLARTLSTTNAAVKYASNKDEIQRITVVGGGVMGSGIAQVCAQSGCLVTVVDDDEYSQRCMLNIMKTLETIAAEKFPYEPKSSRKFITDVLGCITTTQSIEKGCKDADLVIEAIIEDIDIKKDTFHKIDQLAPSHAILASNTSSLNIEDIGSLCKRLDRVIGMHFFNPAYQMRAVEVIATCQTSPLVINKVLSFVRDIGKVPVRCRANDETAGFIVNSLLFPYLLEALRFLERGYASVQDIDTAMKLGAGLPSGPFELIDILGIDDIKFVVDRWHAKYPDNPKYFPSKILNELYEADKLGIKSGAGFYDYGGRKKIMARYGKRV